MRVARITSRWLKSSARMMQQCRAQCASAVTDETCGRPFSESKRARTSSSLHSLHTLNLRAHKGPVLRVHTRQQLRTRLRPRAAHLASDRVGMLGQQSKQLRTHAPSVSAVVPSHGHAHTSTIRSRVPSAAPPASSRRSAATRKRAVNEFMRSVSSRRSAKAMIAARCSASRDTPKRCSR